MGGWTHYLDALIPALALVVAAFVTRQKLEEIHVLVNSNLTNALTEIESLKAEIRKLHAEITDLHQR